MSSTPEITQLEEKIRHLRDEREIINAIENGIIVFKPDLKIQFINEQANKLLACNSRVQEFLGRLTLFKNKKCTIPFKLEKWLKAIIETPSEEPAVLAWQDTFQ